MTISTMYLFRAINNTDSNNYQNGQPLLAANQQSSLATALQSAGLHIASGSKGQNAGCWISTSKSFEICASEFSIPQSGNFNTTQIEKEIIVIDAMYWRGNQRSYKNNGCYSAFTDKNGKTLVDLGDESVYPPTLVNTTKSRNSYNNNGWPYLGKTMNAADLATQLNSFRGIIKSSVQTGILDMSFPTPRDRIGSKSGSKFAPIQEFSLLDYINNGLISNHIQAVSMASGQAKRMKEVLILNQIPFNAIKIKISKLEKEILYALDDANRTKVLDDMMQGTLTFSNSQMNPTTHCLTITNQGNVSQLSYNQNDWALLTKFLVDMAVDNCKNGLTKLSLQQEFDNLKNAKSQLLQSIVKTINSNYKASNLIDNEVSVYCVTENQIGTAQVPRSPAGYYDILAIQDGEKIFDYTNTDFAKRKDKYCKNK